MSKRRKIEVSEETFKFLSRVQNDVGSFDTAIQHYITMPSFQKYALRKYSSRVNILLRLPFSLRLVIIQMIPDVELKYFLRGNMVMKSFQTMKDLSMGEYIRELYGLFAEDKTRKVFLIFRRMGIKTGVGIKKRFSIIPQERTLLSFRYHGGVITEDPQTICSSIPSGLNRLHIGITCLTFVYIKQVNIDSLICLVNQCKFLNRMRLSEIELNDVSLNDQMKLSELLKKMDSVSIIRCKGFTSDAISQLFSSKSLMKLALGGNLLNNLVFPTEPNFSMKFLFLQNNFIDVNVRLSNFPNLKIINISNTRVTYNNLLNLLAHPTLRKLVVVHVRLNRNDVVSIDTLAYPQKSPTDTRRVTCKPSLNLESLSLSSTKLDVRFCRYIGNWCKSLTTLMISKCDIDDYKFSLLRLEEKKNLQTLHIGWNKISKENMYHIVHNCSSIGKLVTPQESIDREFAKIILSSKTLHSLSFRSKEELMLDEELLLSIQESNLRYINLIHHKILSEKDIDFIKFQCLSVRTFKYSYPKEEDRVIWKRCSLSERFFEEEDDDSDF